MAEASKYFVNPLKKLLETPDASKTVIEVLEVPKMFLKMSEASKYIVNR